MKDKLNLLNQIAEEIGLQSVYHIELHHDRIKFLINQDTEFLNKLSSAPCFMKYEDGYLEIKSEKYPNVLFKMEAE